jgi:hypothetical protein
MSDRYTDHDASTTPDTFFISTQPRTEADLRACQEEDRLEVHGDHPTGNYTDPEDD